MISVLLPSHNPNPELLARTRLGLVAQTLPRDRWELLIIDNASEPGNALTRADWSWHPATRIIYEGHLGLTFARCRGFREARGDIAVLVDDDNELAPDFLEQAEALMAAHPQVGAAGGRAIPEFLAARPPWIPADASGLGLRDLGDENHISGYEIDAKGNRGYPNCAPIGAGLIVRRSAALTYCERVARAERPLTDRCGQSLSSGGDNDIVMTVLDEGWKVAYFAQLKLTHVIPAARLTTAYQAALAEGIHRSWVNVLARHGIRPWRPIPPWTAGLRKARAWWRHRAWRGAPQCVQWHAACGIIDGQADLTRFPPRPE